MAMLGEDEDFTWGNFAEVLDALLGAYGQLSPPQELQEYHDASLRATEALRDHARTRPSEDSFFEEFFVVAFEMIGAAMEIGFDTTKTDEEKEQLIEERQQEILGQFFGPDFVAASQAVDDAREALPEETLVLLDDAGCYFDITALGEDEEEAATTAPADEHGDVQFKEPENLLGTFSPGESVRIGDYEVEVTDAYPGNDYQGEDSLTVRALVRNAGDNVLPKPPDCDVHTALEDGEGLRYGRSSCGWSGNSGDAFSPGAEVDYFVEYEAPPENAAGLQWVFSDGETGASFDLSPLLLFHARVLEALVALYNATDGPNWESTSLDWAPDQGWLNYASLYEGYWPGVGVSDNRVIQLNLYDNGLSGPIPPELGNLTDLEILDLSGNELSGPIPPELGNLVNLEKLDLQDNQLSGDVPPELASLANLEWLILGGNQLSGCIPAELRDGPYIDLDRLGLQFCDAAVVPVPTATPGYEVDRAALVALYNATDGPNWTDNYNWLSDAPLGEWYGVYADDNGRVAELELIDNQLSGEIPPELGGLSNLVYLVLVDDQLSGEIPPELGSLSNLEILALEYNQLTGEIPPELGGLSNLVGLWLASNQLIGEIPAELGNLSNLEELYLGGNQLSGCMPAELRDVPYNDLDQLGLQFCDATTTQAPSATPTPAPTADTPGSGGTLWLAIGNDRFPTAGFSPYEDYLSGAEAQINSLIFSRLIRRGPSGLEPDLAESWQAGSDGTEWTVSLRKDVRFHDGRPVTSADVIASIQAKIERFGSLPNIAQHSLIDDFTLGIEFVEPAPDFAERMADVSSVIVPEDMLGVPINDFTALVGSGPFIPDEYQPGVGVEVRSNPNYYEVGLPRLDRIEISFILDPATRFAAYRAGVVDYLGYPYSSWRGLDSGLFDEVASDASFAPLPSVLALWFDTQSPPFDDRDLRLAVLRAIDPTALEYALGAGELQSVIPDAKFPGWTTGYDEPQAVEEWHVYDPDLAEELLAKAGYPDGFLTNILISESLWEAAQIISEVLRSVGIEVEIEVRDPVEHRLAPANMGMKLDWVRASTNDVEGFLREHFSAGGRYNHSRVDIAIPDLDPNRPESIKPVHEVLAEEIYYIPLQAPLFVRRGNIKGPITVYDLYDIGWTLKEVWVE